MGSRSNSPGVQISATSAKFRITACNRSSMSSLTRSSRNVAGPPRRARSIRARSNARSNRMGAAVGFEAMPVGTLALCPAVPLAIRALEPLLTPASASLGSHGRRGITITLHLQPPARRARAPAATRSRIFRSSRSTSRCRRCACPAASRSMARASARRAGRNCRSSHRRSVRGSAFPLSMIPVRNCCRWRRSPTHRPTSAPAPRCAMTTSPARWCIR